MEFIIKGNKTAMKNFGGIILNGQYPKQVKGKKNFIVNSCFNNELSCHWIVCTVDKNEIIIFDSCGVPTCFLDSDLMDFIARQDKRVYYNTVKIQSDSSIMCGIFVLLYIYFLNAGLDMKSFLMCFDLKNLCLNDNVANVLFEKIYK
jgi:hypothetical protein